MPVYNLNGEPLANIYDLNGNLLPYAYDLNGNQIYSKGQPVDYRIYSFTQKWASKGIGATQGFAIHDGKVYWVKKSGNDTVQSPCYVWNLSDGSQALDTATINLYCGHGNNLSFDYPLIYATTAYSPPYVYVNSLDSNNVATLVRTLYINDGCTNCDACIDEDDKTILWTIGHTEENYYLLSKWDLTILTDNGDGTYTPDLLQTVHVPLIQSFYFQGCTFHDGMFWFANGYAGSSVAYVFAVNPATGAIVYTVNCETTEEPEGVAFNYENGEYVMYVGFAGMMLRRYTFKKLNPYQGKTLSILGDSISTYAGFIPSGNANFYTGSNCGVTSVDQTWWKRLMSYSGMTLNLNNSWSASRVSTSNGTASAGCMTRSQNLGTNPDVIIVYMGINDFNHEVALGTWDGTGSVPTSTTTFKEAYAVMLNKIRTAYPDAELCCATLVVCEKNGSIGYPEINDSGVYLTEYNDAIRLVARAFNAKILDFENCGITYANMPTYMGDYDEGTALHPNAEGHLLIAQQAYSDLMRY